MKLQALRACVLSAWLAPILLAVPCTLPAQQPTPQLQDPANLAGERVSPQDLADDLPIDHGALALQQLLRKLRTRASFMLIVAHPDDEDGGMLTYLSRGQGARVAMLTLTRGEGGQNLMSGDFDDALGLIRTQELLAADRYMGVDQFFGTEVDFGFSKTKEEAFAKWTHDRVLYDAVRAVRLYRPLVLASVFIGGPTDGHGHHQVSGEIAQEVFNAAGDPNVFPDQIAAGLQPWQPLKVYARVPFARIDAQGMFDYATNQYTPAHFTNYVTGKVTTTVPKVNVVIPEGNTDPLLGGLSYFQFAREGLALQKTQIGQSTRLASPGQHDVAYHRYGSHLNQPDGDDSGLEPGVFDGIDTSLPGIASLAPHLPMSFRAGIKDMSESISHAASIFDATHSPNSQDNDLSHELISLPLRDALRNADALISGIETSPLPLVEKINLLHELRIKRVQLNDALILAHGLAITATVADNNAGQQLFLGNSKINIDIKANTGSEAIKITHSELATPQVYFDALKTQTYPAHQSATSQYELQVQQALVPTRPYFSRPNGEQPTYDISDPSLRNAPATPAPLYLRSHIDDNGVPLELLSIVGYNDVSTHQPVVVVPPASVTFSRSNGIIRLDEKAPMVWAESRGPISKCISHANDTSDCNKFADQASIHLKLPSGWRLHESADDVLSPSATALTQYDGFTLTPPTLHSGDTFTATAIATWGGKDYSEGYRTVGYAGLTPTNIYTPATYHATTVDLHLPPHLVVGYVKGTGDEVSSSLWPLLGGHVLDVPVTALTPENLKRFDAVILGVRAYEAHPDLAAASPALLAYAQAGGVVIVQYVARDFPAGSTPYPLSLGDNEKVVEEQAPVHLLAPDDPLLTWPNRITEKDFDGWVEERGHGFMSTWDSHYTPLLETHDTGQQSQRGGLLYTHTGKGAWIYLGVALYRQLPEGVPGSYRLFANLISAAHNPAFQSAAPPAR